MGQAPDDTQYGFVVISVLPDQAGRGGYAEELLRSEELFVPQCVGKGRLESLAGFEIDARNVTPGYSLSDKNFERAIGRKYTTTTVRSSRLDFSKSLPERTS